MSATDPAGPLDMLVGTWAGEGRGFFPTIEPFGYLEEITFGTIPTKPFLTYQQRTRHATEGRPLHAETGYWRWLDPPRPDGAVGVEVRLGLGVLGEERAVAGEEGRHAQLDLGQVEGQDVAAGEAGAAAGFDGGRVRLVGGVLAGDAALERAPAGARGVLVLGRNEVPGGVGEVDVRAERASFPG